MVEAGSVNSRERLIDADRLWHSMMEMARIGATEKGGVNRLALTSLDGEARDLFRQWCEDAGCSVTVDAVGNMFARRPGKNGQRAPVATGSHLDTQPKGGKYDGAYGVLAGLEVVRTLNDRKIETEAPIEIVNWTNEEGARFPPVMMGSGTFVGVYSIDETRARQDGGGDTFGAAIDRLGYAGTGEMGADHPFEMFLEAHIEQGPLLEQENRQVGVVTNAQGIVWYDVLVQGMEGHAGTMPMDARKDALVAGCAMVTAINRIANEHGPGARITVGNLSISPGSRNTIPGQVKLQIDMRDPDASRLATLDEVLRNAVMEQAGQHGVHADVEQISLTLPVQFDANVVESTRRAAVAAGIKHMDMVSGAGHDACHIARVAPAGLLFVPCKDGISHNEAESALPEDLAAGCEVLCRVVLEQAAR